VYRACLANDSPVTVRLLSKNRATRRRPQSFKRLCAKPPDFGVAAQCVEHSFGARVRGACTIIAQPARSRPLTLFELLQRPQRRLLALRRWHTVVVASP